MENVNYTNKKYIYVLGNNYDGCLLTGDTEDVRDFKNAKMRFSYIMKILY